MKPIVASLLAGLLTFFAYYALLGGNSNPRTLSNESSVQTAALQTEIEHDGDSVKLEQLRTKLQPKPLQGEDGTLIKHQFLHLHHMKTGGTCTCCLGATTGSGTMKGLMIIDSPNIQCLLLLAILLSQPWMV